MAFVIFTSVILSFGAAHCAAAEGDVSSRVFESAKASVDKEMWHGYGLSNGALGCAAALSNVLKKAGVKACNSALVTAARRQLLASTLGCSERVIRDGKGSEIDDAILLKDCHPGDVVLAFKEPPSKLNGGTSAHCGIMGKGTQVYTNNWMNGIWTEVEIHQMFDYFPYIRLLHLGAGKKTQAAAQSARLTK